MHQTPFQAIFAPFVAQLRDTCNIVSLDGGVDYRQSEAAPLSSLYACGHDASQVLSRTFAALAPAGAQPVAAQVPVPGASRSVAVPMAAGRVCRFSFEELCGGALSAADYLALCGSYDAFVLDGVPAGWSLQLIRDFFFEAWCLFIHVFRVFCCLVFIRSADRSQDELRRFITLLDCLYASLSIISIVNFSHKIVTIITSSQNHRNHQL